MNLLSRFKARKKSARPTLESLEGRALMATGLPISPAVLPAGYFSLGNRQSPVVPKGAPVDLASFIDPTVNIDHARNVGVGSDTYLAPFVNIATGNH